MSSGLSRLESARQPMPTAISAAAAIAEWRAGRGLGGRPRARAGRGGGRPFAPATRRRRLPRRSRAATAIAISPTEG